MKTNTLKKSIASFLLAASLCGGYAEENEVVNWPIEKAPEGSNSAAFAVPRNDWLEQFRSHLERAKQSQIDLLFLGDSITSNWVYAGKDTWQTVEQNYRVANFGIGGDRTEHVLWRLKHGELEGIDPKLIVLLIGSNNLWGNTDDQIVEGIKAILSEIHTRCPNSAVLLMGILPRGQWPTEAMRDNIKQINGNLAGLADGKRIFFLDIGEKLVEPDGKITRDMMGDFLHPTTKGYQIWLDEMQPLIERLCPGK